MFILICYFFYLQVSSVMPLQGGGPPKYSQRVQLIADNYQVVWLVLPFMIQSHIPVSSSLGLHNTITSPLLWSFILCRCRCQFIIGLEVWNKLVLSLHFSLSICLGIRCLDAVQDIFLFPFRRDPKYSDDYITFLMYVLFWVLIFLQRTVFSLWEFWTLFLNIILTCYLMWYYFDSLAWMAVS